MKKTWRPKSYQTKSYIATMRLVLATTFIVVGCIVVAYASWPSRYSDELSGPFVPIIETDSTGYRVALNLREPPPLKHIHSDSNESPTISTLEVFEDGQRLAPPHAVHSTIYRQGGGSFSHWGTTLYFSAADSSNPNSNGRLYSIRYTASSPAWLFPLGFLLLVVGTALALPFVYSLAAVQQALRHFETRVDPVWLPIRRSGIAFVASLRCHVCNRPSASRIDYTILVTIALFGATIGILGGRVEISQSDANQYLTLGHEIATHGHYRIEETEPEYRRREPVLPAAVALVDGIFSLTGVERTDAACLAHSEEPVCVQINARYNIVQIGFLALLAVATGLVVQSLTGNRLLMVVGQVLTLNSFALLQYSGATLTEIPAAAFVALCGWRALLLFRQPSRWQATALGLVCGVLALTKVIFAFLWIPFAILLASALVARRYELKQIGVLVVLIAVGFYLPVGTWMTRNLIVSGSFELSESRATGVLSVRASYNSMTLRQWLTGILVYTPAIQDETILAWGGDAADIERFDTDSPAGFRQAAQVEYRARTEEIVSQSGFEPDATTTERLYAAREIVAQEARAEILDHPVAHLRTSVLLAYRGLFIEPALGQTPTVGATGLRNYQAWDISDWPVFSHALSLWGRTLWNLYFGLSLIIAPLALYFMRRNLEMLVVCLPAIYCHGIYAAVSHFIPRYSVPEVPLRYVAGIVLATVLVQWLWNLIASLWRRIASRS